MDEPADHVVAVATMTVLLTMGVLLNQVLVVAVGAVGVLNVIPQTASRYSPSSASAPLSLFAVAVACALRLARPSAGRSR